MISLKSQLRPLYSVQHWGSKSLHKLFIKILKVFSSLFEAETGISVFVFPIRQNLTCVKPKIDIISKSPFNSLLTSCQFSVFSHLTKTYTSQSIYCSNVIASKRSEN